MISQAKLQVLTELYFYICKKYKDSLQYLCTRFSNNNKPVFTDEEVLTIYIFAQFEEKRFTIKGIHEFINSYYISCFPKLVSYQAFNSRINRLAEVLRKITADLIEEFRPSDCSNNITLLDSMPIITCSGKRKAKVATEITDRGFCSTKKLWHYGLKLHILGWFRPGKLPHPDMIILSKASENDLNIFRENCSNICEREFFGDKIYNDQSFFNDFYEDNNSIMYTPVKLIKGDSEENRQFKKAADDLFSTAVSKIRQPIESTFNWLIAKTDIQRASKVRSINGLLVHVFGKLASAYLYLLFNP
jgi:hypothetical protein